MPPVVKTPPADELTEDQKIAKLAGWSLRYRRGLKELLESGLDEEELDERIEAAEKQLEEEQKAKADQQRKVKIRRRF